MDFIDQIRGVAARIPKQINLLETEEATKNALVMPFIQALGYDVFDPTEVVPEFTADVGTKKGEKVDYAIMVEGQPMLLFECKRVKASLAKEHASQLYRYFSVTAAKIGVLTNGIEYWFFSDLDEPNKMDKQPFMVLDLNRVQDLLVAELKKLTKSSFNLDDMLSAASELKYSSAIKELLAQQLTQPAEDFVRFFAGHVHPGKRLTAGVMQSFEDLVKRAMRDFINERVHERLKTALEGDEAATAAAEESEDDEAAEDDGVVTTEEERTGFRIVQSIVREVVDASRVTIRDAKSYCSVLLDDNNRKPICRMRFNNPKRLQVGLFDDKKSETRVPLSRLDDLYEHAEQLRATIRHYEEGKSTSGESGRLPTAPQPASHE